MGETRLSPNLSLRQSPERRYSPRNGCSPRRCGSPLRHSCTVNINTNINTIQTNNTPSYEQTQFVDYLRMVMDAESRIEKAKIDLALRPDFNVEDAFRIFELDGRGFITEDDLKYGLNVLEIYPTCSDVRLLMKRFDLQKEGVLNFADFFDMVTPYEKDYRSMVENRPPNSCCACRCPDVFMCTTRVYLKNLFNILIDYENKFNCAKRGYTNLRFKLREVFRGIDKFDFGYFNENDLANYLKKNYAFTSTKDSDLLFIRLDRNRNGKVEYWEMEEELAQVF
jgi:Ca2+-binding EF-hand superfamily protein